MLTVRPNDARGHYDHGWLETYHSFSFAEYYDPKHMGFSHLRVINEDRIKPGTGFPTHGHRDMEIITYVLEGGIEHKDSMGNGSIIQTGELQRMTAGTGVTHSEYNASHETDAHFLQIWILPHRRGLTPDYEQKPFAIEQNTGQLMLLASPDGRADSVTIHQNTLLYAGRFEAGDEITHILPKGRKGYLQVVRGQVNFNGHDLATGDGAQIQLEPELQIRAETASEVLLFDLV